MTTTAFKGPQTNAKDTVDKWEEPENTKFSSNEHLNQEIIRFRDGTTQKVSSVPGKEIYEIQHRSGSSLKFNPNGSVVVRTHNGEFNLVFGEKRMKVTGAYDITVEGGGSMRVQGDFNQTVLGSVNMAVEGDYNITAKNVNTQAREKLDTTAGSETKKVEGTSTVEAGVVNINSQNAMNMHSKEGSVTIGAEKGVGLNSKEGAYMQSENGLISMKGKQVTMEASETATLKGADTVIEATAKASINAQDIHTKASNEQKHEANQDYRFESKQKDIHAKAKGKTKVLPPWIPGAEDAAPGTGTAVAAGDPKSVKSNKQTQAKTTGTSIAPRLVSNNR